MTAAAATIDPAVTCYYETVRTHEATSEPIIGLRPGSVCTVTTSADAATQKWDCTRSAIPSADTHLVKGAKKRSCDDCYVLETKNDYSLRSVDSQVIFYGLCHFKLPPDIVEACGDEIRDPDVSRDGDVVATGAFTMLACQGQQTRDSSDYPSIVQTSNCPGSAVGKFTCVRKRRAPTHPT